LGAINKSGHSQLCSAEFALTINKADAGDIADPCRCRSEEGSLRQTIETGRMPE
jgi:hypothetical protein